MSLFILVGIIFSCTLGVGVTVWIGLSIITLCIDECNIVFDLRTVVFGIGFVACGGAVASYKVTRWVFVVFCVGILLSISLIFCNASICTTPFILFLLPFKACTKSLIALMMVSAGVRVGCVVCLSWKRLHPIFAHSLFSLHIHIFCGIGNVHWRILYTSHWLHVQPMYLVWLGFWIVELHIPVVLRAFCCNQSFHWCLGGLKLWVQRWIVRVGLGEYCLWELFVPKLHQKFVVYPS